MKRDEVIQKVEQKTDTLYQKHRVGIEQLKPESDSKLIMKHLDASNRVPSSEEKNKVALTTVYCWGLDVQAGR
jgi:hypothetical protein